MNLICAYNPRFLYLESLNKHNKKSNLTNQPALALLIYFVNIQNRSLKFNLTHERLNFCLLENTYTSPSRSTCWFIHALRTYCSMPRANSTILSRTISSETRSLVLMNSTVHFIKAPSPLEITTTDAL